MALRRIRAVPTNLPQARLYLEDVEEITQILRDNIAPDSVGQRANVLYEIGAETADSIGDLEQLGRAVKSMGISAEIATQSCEVSIGKHPTIHCFNLNEDTRWKVYGSVRQVFERRQLRLLNLLQTHSAWRVLFILINIGLWAGTLAIGLGKGHRRLLIVGLLLTILALASAILLAFSGFGSGSVRLVYLRDKSRLSAADRKKYIQWAAATIIGALLTLAIQWLWHKFIG